MLNAHGNLFHADFILEKKTCYVTRHFISRNGLAATVLFNAWKSRVTRMKFVECYRKLLHLALVFQRRDAGVL